MKLSALEIKQQTFAKALRGYDVAEVQSFLNMVSNEWEHLSNKCRDQEHEIRRLSEKLEHYQKVEEALHETLQSSKESAEQRINTSKQEAQNRIAKADLEAEKIVRDARNERQNIRLSIQRLLERREEIIRGIESYLELATESLDSFKQDKASIYSLPEEEQVKSPPEKEQNASSGSNNPSDSDKQQKKSATPEADDLDDLDDLIDDIDE